MVDSEKQYDILRYEPIPVFGESISPVEASILAVDGLGDRLEEKILSLEATSRSTGLVVSCMRALSLYIHRFAEETSGVDDYSFEFGSSPDYDPYAVPNAASQGTPHNLLLLRDVFLGESPILRHNLTLEQGQSGFSQRSIFPGVRLVTITTSGEGHNTRVLLADKNKIPGVRPSKV